MFTVCEAEILTVNGLFRRLNKNCIFGAKVVQLRFIFARKLLRTNFLCYFSEKE